MGARHPVWLLPLLALLAGAAVCGGPWSAAMAGWRLPALAAAALAVGAVGRKIPARLWLAGGLLLGLIAVYAVNPTHRWSPGVGLLPVAHLAFLPGSAEPGGTWAALGAAVAVWVAFVLANGLSERQVRGLQLAAALAGAAMALVVLAQRLEPGAPRIRPFTGIFVNENHFAVFSNLLLPPVLALASRARYRAVQAGQPSSPAGLFALIAVLMAAATVASGSRAGAAVMALLVAAHVGSCRRQIRAYPFAGRPGSAGLRLAGGAAIAAAAGFAVRAFWNEWQRWGAIGQEWNYRFGIVKGAWAAWREQPVWGTGPGTFAAVFPYYRSETFANRSILHAHCEPIQFLAEFGVAGAAIAAAAGALALLARNPESVGLREMPPFADLERRAFGFGLLACGLHSLIDFPLRVPVLALIAAAWAGAWIGTRPHSAVAAPAEGARP